MSWEPGMKAVCVFDEWAKGDDQFHSVMPKKGDVWTVRSVYTDPQTTYLGLYFFESLGKVVRVDLAGNKMERGFFAACWAPVVESKGMDTLHAILKLRPYEGQHWHQRQKEDKRKRHREKT